jgi:hypothetical protein
VSGVQVRFRNDGGKNYARTEAHLVYRAVGDESTKVTFAWTDASGPHQASYVFTTTTPSDRNQDDWEIPTADGVRTRWVEFEPVSAGK